MVFTNEQKDINKPRIHAMIAMMRKDSSLQAFQMFSVHVFMPKNIYPSLTIFHRDFQS